MELIEEKLRTVTSYHGVIVNVRLDEARLPDGSTAKREVVEHPGGVTVLPLEPDGTVWCVRQYRYPFSRTLLEVPAGKLEPGEALKWSSAYLFSGSGSTVSSSGVSSAASGLAGAMYVSVCRSAASALVRSATGSGAVSRMRSVTMSTNAKRREARMAACIRRRCLRRFRRSCLVMAYRPPAYPLRVRYTRTPGRLPSTERPTHGRRRVLPRICSRRLR